MSTQLSGLLYPATHVFTLVIVDSHIKKLAAFYFWHFQSIIFIHFLIKRLWEEDSFASVLCENTASQMAF